MSFVMAVKATADSHGALRNVDYTPQSAPCSSPLHLC
jgi:hypothetical protein